MDERRLYAILAGGAAVVVLLALVDVVVGGDGDDAPATSTSAATTTTAPGATTTTLDREKIEADGLAQALARNGLTTMKVVYADDGAYTDDPVRLRAVEPDLDYVRGIATPSSVVGTVYVETDDGGQVACASTLSSSGELFLVRDVAQGQTQGTWYARGTALPVRCDAEALSASW